MRIKNLDLCFHATDWENEDLNLKFILKKSMEEVVKYQTYHNSNAQCHFLLFHRQSFYHLTGWFPRGESFSLLPQFPKRNNPIGEEWEESRAVLTKARYISNLCSWTFSGLRIRDDKKAYHIPYTFCPFRKPRFVAEIIVVEYTFTRFKEWRNQKITTRQRLTFYDGQESPR